MCVIGTVNNNAWPKLKNETVNPIWINGSSTTPWPSLGGRRDYVNTNVPSPKWVKPTSRTNPVNQFEHGIRSNITNINTSRDYVNPNIQINSQGNMQRNVANSNTRRNYVNPNQQSNKNQIKPTNTNLPNQQLSSVGSTAKNHNVNEGINEAEDNELREFSENLLKKDVNNAAKLITINYQGRTTSRSQTDEAPEP